jgi:GH3 auxin-responsive promoter
MLSGLFNSIMKIAFEGRIKSLELMAKEPIQAQERVFSNLIKKAADTKWGIDFGYQSIGSHVDYARRVPISSYEEFFPQIERVMKGEENVLWPSKVSWFAKSSGTTNSRSKFIPVSPEALEENHFKAGKDMISFFVKNRPDTKAFQGKGLSIGGSNSINHLNENTYQGDISAVIMKNMPFWAHYMRAASLETGLMANWEEKIEKMARETMDKDVTHITGVPTWTTVLLQRILELKGKKTVSEVWPGLEVFTHGAVAFEPYQPLFEKIIGKPIYYLDNFNASEGFFAVQDMEKEKDLLLLVDHGIFYEFLPTSELGASGQNPIPLQEVKKGVNYAMIISTNAGLWRYSLGDTVKFTSLDPYRLLITGRTKHFINAFGEELMIDNAENAISRACLETDASINNYTAAPVYLDMGKRGGHEWVIEFIKAPEDLKKFAMVLDDSLKAVNSDYEAKREKDIALSPPKISVVPKDTFYQWMKNRGKLGGQNKVPRLSNSREYVEEVLKL